MAGLLITFDPTLWWCDFAFGMEFIYFRGKFSLMSRKMVGEAWRSWKFVQECLERFFLRKLRGERIAGVKRWVFVLAWESLRWGREDACLRCSLFCF